MSLVFQRRGRQTAREAEMGSVAPLGRTGAFSAILEAV